MAALFSVAQLLLLLVCSSWRPGWPLARAVAHNAPSSSGKGPEQQVVSEVMQALDSSVVHQRAIPIGAKCSPRSVELAKHTLAHLFHQMDQYNAIWFNDLDLDEIREGQKQSLANIILAASLNKANQQLVNTLMVEPKSGLPLIEIESSGLRPAGSQWKGEQMAGAGGKQQAIGIRMLASDRKFRCQPEGDSILFSFELALGPLEHHLDVVYNLPKELQLGQPVGWRYAQIHMLVPGQRYAVSLRQSMKQSIDASGCPLELKDVTHLTTSWEVAPLSNANESNRHRPAGLQVYASGLPANNQTEQQLERLFADYTRPAISRNLRQVLKFYLTGKSLPLAAF